jgi:hypothetical protein
MTERQACERPFKASFGWARKARLFGGRARKARLSRLFGPQEGHNVGETSNCVEECKAGLVQSPTPPAAKMTRF